MTTVSDETDPPSTTARIVEKDGTVQFTGTPSDTRAWLVDTEDQLKKSHGIYTKVTVGWALSWAGVALLVAGCVVLLWRVCAPARAIATAVRGAAGPAPHRHVLGQAPRTDTRP